MPRDLLADRKTLDDMSELSRESAHSPPPDNSSLVPHRESNIMKQERLKKSGIHPLAQLLNIEDLDDCNWLEHAAFDPIEAASREKVSGSSLSCLPSHGPCFSTLAKDRTSSVAPLGCVRHQSLRSSPSLRYPARSQCTTVVHGSPSCSLYCKYSV